MTASGVEGWARDEPATEAESADSATRVRRPRPVWWRAVEAGAVVGALLLGLWLRAYVFQMAYVPSDSMAPTLREGDRIIISKLAYRHDPPARGDIVAFVREDGLYVKRVIAVAGEAVAIAQRRVYVDGEPLGEDYTEGAAVMERPMGGVVPDEHLFLLGDNRDRSEDSRDWGPIPLSALIGRATYVVWPIGRMRRLK